MVANFARVQPAVPRQLAKCGLNVGIVVHGHHVGQFVVPLGGLLL